MQTSGQTTLIIPASKPPPEPVLIPSALSGALSSRAVPFVLNVQPASVAPPVVPPAPLSIAAPLFVQPGPIPGQNVPAAGAGSARAPQFVQPVGSARVAPIGAIQPIQPIVAQPLQIPQPLSVQPLQPLQPTPAVPLQPLQPSVIQPLQPVSAVPLQPIQAIQPLQPIAAQPLQPITVPSERIIPAVFPQPVQVFHEKGATITSVNLGQAIESQSEKPPQIAASESKRIGQEIKRPTGVVVYQPELTYAPSNIPAGLSITTHFQLPQTSLKLGPTTYRQQVSQPVTSRPSVCSGIVNATQINRMKREALIYYLAQLGLDTGGKVKDLKDTLKKACKFSS